MAIRIRIPSAPEPLWSHFFAVSHLPRDRFFEGSLAQIAAELRRIASRSFIYLAMLHVGAAEKGTAAYSGAVLLIPCHHFAILLSSKFDLI